MPSLEIAIVLLLTLLNGLLSMSEMAVVSSRKARLKTLSKPDQRNVQAVLRLREDPSGFLATVQIGITLVGILAGAFSGATLAGRLAAWLDRFPIVAPHGQAVSIVVTVVGITYFSLVLGELVPKRIAMAYPERIATAVARPMRTLSFLAAPVVWLLKVSSDLILGVLGLSEMHRAGVTEEEVKSLIAEGAQAGIFEPQEREMIEGVLRLADRPVRMIMTPRADVAWLDVQADRAELQAVLASRRHSRLLVCEDVVDRPVGVVHTKDLLAVALDCAPLTLATLMTPVLFIPETTPVLKLLERFKHEKLHVAVVVDEHGTMEGIVTPTDVLESIAGELPEKGEEEEPWLIQRDETSWLVDGRLAIDEFEGLLNLPGICQVPDVYTVAGFILHHLEHLPKTGENFQHRNLRFEVVDMDRNRIDKILVQVLPPLTDDDPSI